MVSVSRGTSLLDCPDLRITFGCTMSKVAIFIQRNKNG